MIWCRCIWNWQRAALKHDNKSFHTREWNDVGWNGWLSAFPTIKAFAMQRHEQFSPQPRELIRYIVNQKKFRRGMSFWFVAISWFDPMMWIKIYALFLIIFNARAINDPTHPTYLSWDTEYLLNKCRERIFHAQPVGSRNYVGECSRK